jgi:hypothetical protein
MGKNGVVPATRGIVWTNVVCVGGALVDSAWRVKLSE